MQLTKRAAGYTYIELMAVIGIVALLSTLVTVVSMTAMTRSQANSQIDFLLSDLSFQQQQAANRVLSAEPTQRYGVFVHEDGYVLFQGSSYVAGKATNQNVSLPIGMKISTINLPLQQIIYDQGSGFVYNWQATRSGMILTSPLGTATTMTINRYGVVETTK